MAGQDGPARGAAGSQKELGWLERIEELKAILVGEAGLMPEQFWLLTPRDAQLKEKGYYQRIERENLVTRRLMTIQWNVNRDVKLYPHGLSENELLPFSIDPPTPAVERPDPVLLASRTDAAIERHKKVLQAKREKQKAEKEKRNKITTGNGNRRHHSKSGGQDFG